MTEPRVTLIHGPAGDVMALDLWDARDAAELLAGVRHIQVEPRRWWVFDADAALAARIGDAGALAPIGGGFVCATIAGPGWRTLLSVSGVFDSEDPALTTGSMVATVIHHVAVRIVVTGDNACAVYFAASYAPDLIALWTTIIAGGGL